MCMTCRTEVNIPEVQCFKLFSQNKEGHLQSVFVASYKDFLKYPTNERIRVDVKDATFFAFERFRDAVKIARQGRNKWNMVRESLIVLPVTLYDVVACGKFEVQSDDPQSMNGYYAAFESKEIIVHDSPDRRNAFYDQVMADWIELAKYTMSSVEKEAFRFRMPQFAELLK